MCGCGSGATGISSQKRTMSLEGYEKEVYIDPNRKIEAGQIGVDWDKEKMGKKAIEVRSGAKGTVALEKFENAAIGAKLRNTNKVLLLLGRQGVDQQLVVSRCLVSA